MRVFVRKLEYVNVRANVCADKSSRAESLPRPEGLRVKSSVRRGGTRHRDSKCRQGHSSQTEGRCLARLGLAKKPRAGLRLDPSRHSNMLACQPEDVCVVPRAWSLNVPSSSAWSFSHSSLTKTATGGTLSPYPSNNWEMWHIDSALQKCSVIGEIWEYEVHYFVFKVIIKFPSLNSRCALKHSNDTPQNFL